MRYISTRGDAPALKFDEVLLAGLATDGGLYVPELLPRFTQEQIASWAGLSYSDLAFNVMYPFVEGSIPEVAFKSMVDDTYQQFAHTAIAPLKQLAPGEWVMELFQGPTLAFKDFALQLLGRLLDYVLAQRKERVVIMGATSVDTGSAAIEGCKKCDKVDIFILHPHERVSEVQRRQMTTVTGNNIYNIAVQGNFDDCQQMVKDSFNDQSFLKGTRLVAVNSINWARIMAQIVYYFYASLSLGGPSRSLSFSVPTGNFGDIYAGYLARNMGLPINQLIVATNKNDILHRFISKNHYGTSELEKTLSPSMDIMISSNFERLLFDLHGKNGGAIKQMMADFPKQPIQVDDFRWDMAKALFDSCSVDDAQTCAAIKAVYQQSSELLDPHTAIGVVAARTCRRDHSIPMVTLATAHPAKFPEAIERAAVGVTANLPQHLSDLFERDEHYDVLPKSLAAVQQYVQSKARPLNPST